MAGTPRLAGPGIIVPLFQRTTTIKGARAGSLYPRRSPHLRFHLLRAAGLLPFLTVGFGLPSGRAAEPSTGGDVRPGVTRLDLVLGGGWRKDEMEQGTWTVVGRGAALSDLAARVAWWRPGARLGLTGQLQLGRFALSGAPGPVAVDPVDLTGMDAVGAVALRAAAGGGGSLEVQLGYGLHRIPAAGLGAGPAGDTRLEAGGPRGHGPNLAAGLRHGFGRRWQLELGGQGLPALFGARHAGQNVTVRRLEGRAAVTMAFADLRTARLWALLAYEHSVARAEGAGVELSQRRQQVGLGLRASWGHHPSVQRAPAPPPVAPVSLPPLQPRPSAISGLVRAEDGAPVAARISISELGESTLASANGAFRFEVPPGRYTLQIEAAGFLPQTKLVSAGAGEERIYNIDLLRKRP